MNYVLYFSDPSNWLQKYDSMNTEKIKLIQPVYWKQGFCVDVEDRTTSTGLIKYLCLLYDKKRTDNFLTFIKGELMSEIIAAIIV